MHRTVLKLGPPKFEQWFCPSTVPVHPCNTRLKAKTHDKQLHSYLAGRYTELLRRSPLGLVEVYNKLPQEAVNQTSVKDFQKWLQNHVKEEVRRNTDDWENCFNNRRKSWRVKPRKQA